MCRLHPVLLLSVLLACNNDPVEPPKASNITRAWELTKCQYVNLADQTQTADLIAEGYEIFLYINDNSQFAYVVTPPGEADQVLNGTWRIAGSKLVLSPTGGATEWSFSARVQEETMSLRGAQADYDFDGDGTPEPARWNMAMTN